MLQIQEIEMAKLHPWEDNPRLNNHAVNAVAESIRAFGFNVPILSDQNFTIVAGHTRWKAANNLGMRFVPVILVEMTETQRKAFAIADNKTAEIADWDIPKLKDILKELSSEDVDIKSLGFSDEDLRDLLKSHNMGHEISKGYVEEIGTIDPMKLAFRLEAVCHCAKRDLAIDLFSGQGRLAFWYMRLFGKVVRVDKENFEGTDFIQKADTFLKKHLHEFENFDFIDFDDEGCPAKELQFFFSLVQGRKKPFVLCLTDGMGLAFKLRGKINIFDKYLYGESGTIKIKNNVSYERFDQYLKHLIDTLCIKNGFNNHVLNWHRGAQGNVIYAGFEIFPNK
jgi:hypothetical protein